MTAQPSHDLLAVRDLAFSRGGQALVAGLSFSLKSGEALVLRGPNGSGKTTLLRILAGLGLADSGRLAWDDTEAGDDPDLLAGLSVLIGHKTGLKADLTVAESLAFWTRLNGEGADRLDEAVATFGLGHLADLPVKYLSAGQQRRCALARLVMTSRPVWLLDEPTTALDTDGRAALAGCLDRHRAGGGLAVIATHDSDFDAAKTVDLRTVRAGVAA